MTRWLRASQVVAKIQKAAAARAALEATLADEPVRLDALDAALETARGARGLLDDVLLATADAAHQVTHCLGTLH